MQRTGEPYLNPEDQSRNARNNVLTCMAAFGVSVLIIKLAHATRNGPVTHQTACHASGLSRWYWQIDRTQLIFCFGCLICLKCIMATLVMSSGGVYKIIFGWVIPLDVKLPIAIIYNHNFQFQYPTVDNSAQVSYVLSGGRNHARTKRAVITRNHVYSLIEKIMETNQVDRDCLLRAICETSASPLAHNGLFGEIIEHVLRPKTSSSEDVYSKAWGIGLKGNDCFKQYSQCPYGYSVLDHISYYK